MDETHPKSEREVSAFTQDAMYLYVAPMVSNNFPFQFSHCCVFLVPRILDFNQHYLLSVPQNKTRSSLYTCTQAAHAAIVYPPASLPGRTKTPLIWLMCPDHRVTVWPVTVIGAAGTRRSTSGPCATSATSSCGSTKSSCDACAGTTTMTCAGSGRRPGESAARPERSGFGGAV